MEIEEVEIKGFKVGNVTFETREKAEHYVESCKIEEWVTVIYENDFEYVDIDEVTEMLVAFKKAVLNNEI